MPEIDLINHIDGFTASAIWGAEINDRSGINVTAGDVDGDGLSDIIIGASDADSVGGFSGAGEICILLGRIDFPAIIDLGTGGNTGIRIIEGASAGDAFGRKVTIGDFNNDGFDDVLVGSSSKDANIGGAVILWGGEHSAGRFNVNDLGEGQKTNLVGSGQVGRDVSPAGDANGDGVDDYIVSATTASEKAGEVYFVYGEAVEMPPTLAMTGACPGEMVVDISSATPGATVAVYHSLEAGDSFVPEGKPCVGSPIGLVNPKLLVSGLVDGSGKVSLNRVTDESQCSLLTQAMDTTTCMVTDVVVMPSQ